MLLKWLLGTVTPLQGSEDCSEALGLGEKVGTSHLLPLGSDPLLLQEGSQPRALSPVSLGPLFWHSGRVFTLLDSNYFRAVF